MHVRHLEETDGELGQEEDNLITPLLNTKWHPRSEEQGPC